MKILITMFMFFGLLFSSDVKENIEVIDCVECQSGSMDYCTGYVEGMEQQSGHPMSGRDYARNHNSYMASRGCPPHFPGPQPPELTPL